MTNAEMIKRVQLDMAGCMAACADVDFMGTPESHLYILVGMDMERWGMVRRLMVEAKLATISGNLVTLTPHGKSLAVQFKAALLAE